jgi:predicted O-linked N-acetylglucosamine transferase (SPINDLY family)
LTCAGETFAGRVAGSLLTAIGLGELVTSSLEQYQQTATALIVAPERLKSLRGKIERERDVNSLFDLPASKNAIEAAYERMWQRWRDGEKPVGFSIHNV